MACKLRVMKVSKPKYSFWLSIHHADVKIIDRMYALRGYVACLPWARAISFIGDGWLYLLIALLSFISHGPDHPYFWMLFLGFLFERPSYYLIKNTLKRQRPFHLLKRPVYLQPTDEFSLPSGHTSAAFLFAVISATFVPQYLIVLMLMAALIGLSRVALGVHFLSDVFLGAILGISYAFIAVNLVTNFFSIVTIL